MQSRSRILRISRRTALASLAVPLLARALPSPRGELVVGQSAPLTGMMAPTVTGLLEGQQLAVDDANRRGGIGGRPLRLLVLDDGFDARRTLENAQMLVEGDKVVALFGLVGTAQTAAVLPYIAERKVPLISAYTGSPALRLKPHPTFFTTQASYADELVRMVRNLKAVMASRIGIVYQDNEFGKLLLPLAQKVIADEGCTVAAAKPIEVAGVDAVPVAQAMAAAHPQAVILIVAGPAVVAYVKANRAHAGVPVYTFSLSVGASTLKALGDDARGLAVSRATPYPWRATSPLTRTFADLMEKAGKPVDYDHFAGYINARVLIEGLRGAGRDPTPASLTQAMEKLGQLDLGGYTLEYGPQHHHGSNFVEITVVGPRGNFMR